MRSSGMSTSSPTHADPRPNGSRRNVPLHPLMTHPALSMLPYVAYAEPEWPPDMVTTLLCVSP